MTTDSQSFKQLEYYEPTEEIKKNLNIFEYDVLFKYIDDAMKKACAKLVLAMINCPEMIGGTNRLDTMLMQAAEGRIISKVGADGGLH